MIFKELLRDYFTNTKKQDTQFLFSEMPLLTQQYLGDPSSLKF